ncbi:LuxR C-terminal-related transcriptional regulator, partial [Propionibacterium freudenreichii]
MEPHPTETKPLSPQQRRVLSGVAQGKSRAQIAKELGISINTVRS